jgi:hypothetical protein
MGKESKEIYYDLDSSTEDLFMEIFNKKSFPMNIKFLFQGNSKQKQLVKVSKISDQYAFALGKELLISVNEDLLNVFDDDSITILIEQEIDKININMESGKIKLVSTDLNTFSSIVNKWGVEKVARANKVEELYVDQQKDAKGDEEFII